MGVIMQVYKDGITITIKDKDWQRYRELGFVQVQEKPNKPEPMVIEEEPKAKTKK